MSKNVNRMDNAVYDVVIIGGGVIGCAVLHELTLQGYACMLVDKEAMLCTGASSGNSGIAHTGFDASSSCVVESKCLKDSQALLPAILKSYNVPYKQVGAIIVAWSDSELERLSQMKRNAEVNFVTHCRMLNKTQLLGLEPNLNRAAKGGLLIPGEAVIDSFILPTTLAHHAVRSGSHILLNWKIASGKQVDKIWELTSLGGTVIRGRVVVNAAGLYGDKVEEISRYPNFTIKPRKGQFVVYGKDAGCLINHILLPVPTEITKGIIVYPSVYGDLVVGPTAEDCNEFQMPSTSKEVTKLLIEHGERVVPMLKEYTLVGVYAGLRPATETKDYHLSTQPDQNWITVGGIRSTGVSSCLGVAKQVHQLLLNKLLVAPSKSSNQSAGCGQWWSTGHSTIVIDGTEYSVTHPLSKLGLSTFNKELLSKL